MFLVVASVVGSGIFKTPGEIASQIPHVSLIFAVWTLGGLLSLAGALANAELGAMFPHAGGDYVFLRRAFHPIAGFMIGWITFFAIFAGTVATLAVAFAEDLGKLLAWSRSTILLAAAVSTLLCTWLNVAGVRYGVWANNATGWLKVVALGAFCLVVPFLTATRPDSATGELALVQSPSLRGFMDAIPAVLFSYLGWNATVYVASEIRDPARNVPRSLFVGLALCTGIYLLMNAVYLNALGLAGLRGASNAAAATALATLGPIGGKLLTGFVLISILGTLNATILVGARIAYAMALDGIFVPGVERVHDRYRTPALALWLQAAVAIAILGVLQTFPGALEFTTFAIVLATTADVLALFALRIRQPEIPRPYRAWGYPVVPALYVLANVGIAFAMLSGSATPALFSLGVSVASVPFYFLFSRLRSAA